MLRTFYAGHCQQMRRSAPASARGHGAVLVARRRSRRTACRRSPPCRTGNRRRDRSPRSRSPSSGCISQSGVRCSTRLGIVQVQQQRAEPVELVRPDRVVEREPAVRRLDRRRVDAQLERLPRILVLDQQPARRAESPADRRRTRSRRRPVRCRTAGRPIPAADASSRTCPPIFSGKQDHVAVVEQRIGQPARRGSRS